VPGLGVVIGLAMLCNLWRAHSAAFWYRWCSALSRGSAVSSGVFDDGDRCGRLFAFLGIATLWFGLK
jgi:hypothetical protein